MSSIALPADDTTSTLRAPIAPTRGSVTSATESSSAPTDDDPRTLRNRANAARSTGPRTPDGKRRSAQNARKHALTADGVLNPLPADPAANPLPVPPDLRRDADYAIREQELREEFAPATPAQHYLFDQLVLCAWKLGQIPRLERQLLATPVGQLTPTPLPPPPPPIPDLPEGQQLPPDLPPEAFDFPPDPTVQLTARHLLQPQPTALVRLWNHHHRLVARFQSLARQIRQMQRDDHRRRREQADEPDRHRRDRDRHDRDHDTLTEMSNAIHERNQERKYQEHLARHRAANEGVGRTSLSAREAPSEPQPAAAPDNAPAQNEPTPPSASVPSVPSVFHPAVPAQNEPTTDQLPMTNDQFQTPPVMITPPTEPPCCNSD